MQRFFVPPETFRGATARLDGELAQQVRRVLRLRPGDRIVLLDGSGSEYLAQINEYGKDEVWCGVISETPGTAEPAHAVDLYLALLNKPDKYEWALQKCTELGVSRFVPLRAERSVSAPPEKGKRERWERIIREAAEQSGRATLPVLDETLSFGYTLEAETRRMSGAHITIMPTLGAGGSLRDALSAPTPGLSVSLLIGPEGGFSDREVAQASEAGVLTVSLGPRTLRAETAAVTALALVMHELGEMSTSSARSAGIPPASSRKRPKEVAPMPELTTEKVAELTRRFFHEQIAVDSIAAEYSREDLCASLRKYLGEMETLAEGLTPQQLAYRLPGTPSGPDASGDEAHFNACEIVTHVAQGLVFYQWGITRALGHPRPTFLRPPKDAKLTGTRGSILGYGGWNGLPASDLARLLRDTSSGFLSYVESLPPEADSSATSRYEPFGQLPPKGWLCLAVAHAANHLQQLREMQAQPGYPA